MAAPLPRSAAVPVVATPPRTTWRLFVTSSAIVFIAMLLWSLASPLMSSPDEPAHAIRAAAVVRGDLTGTVDPDNRGAAEVTVPRFVADSDTTMTCFATRPELSAACQPGETTDPNELVSAHTAATLNTPVFYVITGWPTLFLSGNVAFYVMRAVVALVCALLLGTMFAMVGQLPRYHWSMLAGATALTPMVLFLSGSINPSAVEICAAAALLASLTVTLRTHAAGRRLVWRVVAVAASTFLLVNTRSISLVWLLLIVITSLILAKRVVLIAVFRRRSVWAATAVIGVVVAAALWWFLIPKGLTQVYAQQVGVGGSWKSAFTTMIAKTLDYGTAWIGVFGWLDTPSPLFALATWTTIVGGMLVVAYAVGSRRSWMAVSVLLAALILVPAVVQAALVFEWGYVWQGRYTLAIFVCLILAAGFALDAAAARFPVAVTRRILTVSAALLAAAHVTTFVFVLKRYVVGLGSDDSWSAMLLRPQWQPPLGWITLSVLFALTLVAGILALRRSCRPEQIGSTSLSRS